MAKNSSLDYKLGSVLNIRDAARIKKDLLALFKREGGSINIRLDTCEKLDLSVLQLLAAFVREARIRKIDLRMQGPLNPNLSQVLEDTDFLRMKGNKLFLFEQLKEGGVEIEC